MEFIESLDAVVNKLLEQANLRAIPVFFALKKSVLGRTLGKKMNMSFASILSEDGANEIYKEAVALSLELQKEKQAIDTWLETNLLNDCGDPIGTEYEKYPLDDANSGTRIDRYRYLQRIFPEKPWQKQ